MSRQSAEGRNALWRPIVWLIAGGRSSALWGVGWPEEAKNTTRNSSRPLTLPEEMWRGQLLPRGLPMRGRDLLKPALAVRRVNYRGDVRLPTLAIEIVRSVKRIA